MRKIFKEYYKPTFEETSKIWEEGIFVLDANVLLDLYRYSKATRTKLLTILSAVRQQLWIPYWVGYEFHKDRITVIEQQRQVYASIIKDLESTMYRLDQYSKHPTLKIEPIRKTLLDLKNRIKAQKTRHISWYDSDEILEEITEIFDERVGEPYDSKRLTEIVKEGEERYKKRQPPGYKDSEKIKHDPSGLRAYGDLIIWHQIMDKAKLEKKPIIFVTEDGKEDWWNPEFHGQKRGPRTELIAEMYAAADVPMLMYDIEQFMKEAGEKYSSPITEKAIEEIQQLKTFTSSSSENTAVVSSDLADSAVASETIVVSNITNEDNNTGGTQ